MYIITRHPPGLQRECRPDLSDLQVPGDDEEPVPPPAGPPGSLPLQGEDCCRSANQEALHLSHAGLRQQTLPGLAGKD